MLSAFAAAGIEPFNPLTVLGIIKNNTISVSYSDSELSARTPVDLHALRRQIKVIKQKSGAFIKKVDSVARIAEKLSIQKEILEYKNIRFRKALIAK